MVRKYFAYLRSTAMILTQRGFLRTALALTIASGGCTAILGGDNDYHLVDSSSGSASGGGTSSSSSSVGGTGGSGGTGGINIGPPPAIGTQIDRFGRPAINTALNKTFSSDTAMKDAAKDTWNKDANAATWAATFGPEVVGNLAVLDSLDTICGNQPLAAPEPITPTRYVGLAGALADDRLWVNTAGTACGQYLAVEADAALGVENSDCGGRTLAYDVVDVSYSFLMAGDLQEAVSDGLEGDPAEIGGEVFPYLADPH